jgi:hypothetical protein
MNFKFPILILIRLGKVFCRKIWTSIPTLNLSCLMKKSKKESQSWLLLTGNLKVGATEERSMPRPNLRVSMLWTKFRKKKMKVRSMIHPIKCLKLTLIGKLKFRISRKNWYLRELWLTIKNKKKAIFFSKIMMKILTDRVTSHSSKFWMNSQYKL